MDIVVEHNSVDVSSYVISYTRESKICTGVATLEMEMVYTYPTAILPWDTISIIEEGNRVATFYVGQVTDSQPGAVITINAQDNSKRLTDYFITDNHTVERRSHAKKWITKFLNEAGVDWKFTASGNGGILTNNTTMGMQSAYEQIMTLLQLSGWYIRFDEYGKAFIGELSTVPPNFSTVNYVNFPCSGIFTGNGNLPGYGDFPCSGTFIGIGLITGHEVHPHEGIFLLDSTFTGEGDIVGSGTFPCAGIFHGNGFYTGAGTFPGNGTFSGDGNFTDPGVYPGYSAITTSGIFTCYGTYPKVGMRLDNDIILDIKLDKNDRMYRNRVVVWGNGDSDTGSWVFADVSLVGNKWDYDANDRRTIVIANSNIPDSSDAFDLANQALMEFGRLSVEKRLTVAGAVPVKVGDIVLVINELFTGNGMVTSFGVSMSKAGLISSIVLDERCPRLFGYFHPRLVDDIFPSGTLGFPVYVSTFGDGVWRKTNSGITESGWAGSMWENYSYGLTELDITDLHVNEGVLVNVTSAGDSYSSLEANGYWEKINLNSLSVTASGVVENYTNLKARACIIDRDSNSLRIVVDNNSGINNGDFLTDTSPFDTTRFSGYLLGSQTAMRAWVVDASPNGAYVLDSYPVNYSGNYEFFATDIANDGTYDYVEAVTLGSGSYPYNLCGGIYEGANSSAGQNWDTEFYNGSINYDSRMSTFMSYLGIANPMIQPKKEAYVFAQYGGGRLTTDEPMSLYDELPTGSAWAGWVERGILGATDFLFLNITEFFYDPSGSGDLQCFTYQADSITYPNMVGSNLIPGKVVLIKKIANYVFDFYVLRSFMGSDYVFTNRFDALNSTLTVTLISTTPSRPTSIATSGDFIVGDILYAADCTYNTSRGFDVTLYSLNIVTGAANSDLIVSANGVGTGTPVDPYVDKDIICIGPIPILFQHGSSDLRLICPYNELVLEEEIIYPPWPDPPFSIWYYTSKGVHRITYNLGESYKDDSLIPSTADITCYANTVDDYYSHGNFNLYHQYYCYQLAGGVTHILQGVVANTPIGEVTDTFDGYKISLGDGSSPIHQYDTVYSLRGTDTDAVGKLLDGTFTNINTSTGEPGTPIIPADAQVYLYNDFSGPPPWYWEVYPCAVTLLFHQGTVDSFNGEHFYKADLMDVGECTIALSKNNVVTRITDEVRSYDYGEENMFGNFRIGGESFVGAGRKNIKYVDPGDLTAMWPIYILFARDGEDYILLKSGMYQERVEVSEYYPIVTMDRRVSSLESRLIPMDGVVQLSTHPAMIGYNIPNSSGNISVFGAGITADDFRYADFSRVAESGLSREILVVYSGGVGSIDAITLASFSGLYTTYSGNATRIETTNYQLPGQYVFLSVSGDMGDMSFFQRDPDGDVWVDYSSGYPQSRTTMIRIDDSI